MELYDEEAMDTLADMWYRGKAFRFVDTIGDVDVACWFSFDPFDKGIDAEDYTVLAVMYNNLDLSASLESEIMEALFHSSNITDAVEESKMTLAGAY